MNASCIDVSNQLGLGALIEETWYVCGFGSESCQKLFQRRQLFLRPPPANLSLSAQSHPSVIPSTPKALPSY